MKVCITGAAGFIGSHLVEACLEAGYDLLAVDNLSRGKRENLPQGVTLYETDVDGKKINLILEAEQPDMVVHLAAQVDVSVSVNNPVFDADINIKGALNLLEACGKVGVRKVVYASTAAVYGFPQFLPVTEVHPVSPLAPYGVSKYVMELYLKFYREHYGIDYTVLRYANVYGPGQGVNGEGGVVAIFLDRLLKGDNPVIYGDGEQTRDFVYVKDVVHATLAALDRGSGEVLNISTGKQVTINELFTMLKRFNGLDTKAQYHAAKPGDIRYSCLDNTRAKSVLGWVPQYSLLDGLEETVDWARKMNDRVN